jgi:HEAT repeat protein
VREVAALVEHYLREWKSSGWADAYHSLIELGPQVLPELEARLETSSDAALRAALLEVARHMHSPAALAMFAHGLKDATPAVWKEALDGLVDLANPEAVALLEEAAVGPPPGRTSPADWTAWLTEALNQARRALEGRGGAVEQPDAADEAG